MSPVVFISIPVRHYIKQTEKVCSLQTQAIWAGLQSTILVKSLLYSLSLLLACFLDYIYI